jgi:hypothetical protein
MLVDPDGNWRNGIIGGTPFETGVKVIWIAIVIADRKQFAGFQIKAVDMAIAVNQIGSNSAFSDEPIMSAFVSEVRLRHQRKEI